MSAYQYLFENYGYSLNSLHNNILIPLGINPSIKDVFLITAIIQSCKSISTNKVDITDRSECLIRSKEVYSSYASIFSKPYIPFKGSEWEENISLVLSLHPKFVIMIMSDNVSDKSYSEIKKFIKDTFEINAIGNDIASEFRYFYCQILNSWEIAIHINNIIIGNIELHSTANIFSGNDTFSDVMKKYINSKKQYHLQLDSQEAYTKEADETKLILASLFIQLQKFKSSSFFC
jgi:hypothetical protein